MTMLVTPYGPIDKKLLVQLRQIKLLACDVDGVFSDGRIYMGQNGEELKAFHTRDGHPILAAQAHYQTRTKGGFGAVRELCDLILLSHGQLYTIQSASI
jgi:3-deoxy-D-manno-octulosonate 8-phosphate phosphatase KdsC-like HAD superfamily phosphatase